MISSGTKMFTLGIKGKSNGRLCFKDIGIGRQICDPAILPDCCKSTFLVFIDFSGIDQPRGSIAGRFNQCDIRTFNSQQANLSTHKLLLTLAGIQT